MLGIISSCRAREAILQPAELAELVLRDQITTSVRAVDRGASKPFCFAMQKLQKELDITRKKLQKYADTSTFFRFQFFKKLNKISQLYLFMMN